jgi:FMN phosphatase YigB (HAD superfamily)
LLIGDDLTADYEGALAAGWQALHVDRSLANDAPPMIQCLTSVIELLA